MALHKIIEKHQVNILGQEIIYTNEFIRYNESTSFSSKPTSSLISQAVRLFRYKHEHKIPPALFTNFRGETFIVPTWQKVHPKTTLKDIEWIKPVKEEAPVEKNNWKFESSSDPGHFYTVRQNGLKLTCTCNGFWRCKDKTKGCKHIQDVHKQLNNDNK